MRIAPKLPIERVKAKTVAAKIPFFANGSEILVNVVKYPCPKL